MSDMWPRPQDVVKRFNRATLVVKFDDYRDNFDLWMEAMKELGMTPEEYQRERDLDEDLPWDIIDVGVSKDFFKRELEKSKKAALSHDCRKGCLGCGMKGIVPECGTLTTERVTEK